MSCCNCESTGKAFAKTAAQRRVLWLVLAINLVIFVGEFVAGWFADSSALQGDSLDSLGDATVYGLSLIVLDRSLRARAGAALIKGGIQLTFAAAVLAEVAHKLIFGATPLPQIMAIAAATALIANLICLVLLTRFRSDDINMRSVWLCSRNDVLGNLGILLTTGLIAWTHWMFMDLIFGALLAVLFARTGAEVVASAWPQIKAHSSPVP